MTSDSVVRIGVVGAGPWAGFWTAPMAAAGPGTSLAGVWARRPEPAAALAGQFGVPAFDGEAGLAALFEVCDAVAFVVPPPVQAVLAPRAAAAGKHLLLEKPLAFTVPDAEAIAAAVEAAGVVTQIVLTNRWTTAAEAFLAALGGSAARVVDLRFVSAAALPGSPFATGWRDASTALFDLGPHALDLLEAAAGPVAQVSGRRSGEVTALTLEHDSGAVSHVTLSVTTPGADGRLRCVAVTDDGVVELADPSTEDHEAVRRRIVTTFADAVTSGTAPALDVHRGVRLQRLLAAAQAALG